MLRVNFKDDGKKNTRHIDVISEFLGWYKSFSELPIKSKAVTSLIGMYEVCDRNIILNWNNDMDNSLEMHCKDAYSRLVIQELHIFFEYCREKKVPIKDISGYLMDDLRNDYKIHIDRKGVTVMKATKTWKEIVI